MSKHDDSFPRIVEDSLLYSFRPKLLGLIYIFEILFVSGIFGSVFAFLKTFINLYKESAYMQLASQNMNAAASPVLKAAMEKAAIHFFVEFGIVFILGIIASLVLKGLIIRGSYEFFEKKKDKGIRSVLSEMPKIAYFRAFIYLIFVVFVSAVITDIFTYVHIPRLITDIILILIIGPLFVFALPEIYIKEKKFVEGISKSVRIFKEKYYYVIPAFAVEYIIAILINLVFAIPLFLTLYKFGVLHMLKTLMALEHGSSATMKASESLIMMSMINSFKVLLTKGKVYLVISYFSLLLGSSISLIFRNSFISRIYGALERKLKI